jgi:hypothetical protein
MGDFGCKMYCLPAEARPTRAPKPPGYTRDDGSKVAFFTLVLAGDRHCINFPLMASILAGLEEESSKALRATQLSTLAIVISIAVPVIDWLSKST